jgi:hypothetical protein
MKTRNATLALQTSPDLPQMDKENVALAATQPAAYSKSNAGSSAVLGAPPENPLEQSAKDEPALSPFIQKLAAICETTPPHVGHWADDGTYFVVVNSRAFKSVLSSTFSASKAEHTFIRQLHYYGFHKFDVTTESGQRAWAFSHASFLRDVPEELPRIVRRVKGSPMRPKKHKPRPLRRSVRTEGRKAVRLSDLEDTVSRLEEKAQDIGLMISQFHEQIVSNFYLLPANNKRSSSLAAADADSLPAEMSAQVTVQPVTPLRQSSVSSFWNGSGLDASQDYDFTQGQDLGLQA